ncbi:MAG: BatD family protein, partial [Gemmatimonadales bacterium]
MKSSVVALTISLAASSAAAQEVSVTANLDRNEVGVNETFVLSIEIEGVQRLASQPDLPDVEGFAFFLGSSSSQSVQIVNGRMSASYTLEYRYQATTTGEFEIPPIELEIEGRRYSTAALTVKIVDQPTQPTQPRRRNAFGDDTAVDPEDLFLEASVDRRSAYPGQPVVVEYRIYTRLSVSSYSITRLPSTAGFWVEEFELPPSPVVEEIVRDGKEYASAVIRKVAMYPTSPGTRT